MSMTEKEVRGLLHSIKDQDEELEKKLIQLAELRTAVENCTAKLDKDGSQHSMAGDKLSNLMCKIVDLEKECENLHISVNSIRKSVVEMSKSLAQDRHKEYLTLRFVKCNGFYDTVMKMNLSDSTARRIDRKAISELTRIINATDAPKRNF